MPSQFNALKKSIISDYFPQKFEIDLVGKKFAWLGEVLLPFIDSNRLLRAMGSYEENLTLDEKRLNKLGNNYLYISKYGDLGRNLSNTENLQIGQRFKVNNQDHNITGDLFLLMQYNQTATYQFYFYQPLGLIHNIQLKQGIQYNPLQQISKDFISRTDKRSYGGQRFTRVIERSLAKRIQVDRKRNIFTLKQNQNDRIGNQNRQQRDRSRENYRHRDNNRHINNNNYRQRNNIYQNYQNDRSFNRTNYHVQNRQQNYQNNYGQNNNQYQHRNNRNSQNNQNFPQHQINQYNNLQYNNTQGDNYRLYNQQQTQNYYQNNQRNNNENISGQDHNYNNSYNQRNNQ